MITGIVLITLIDSELVKNPQVWHGNNQGNYPSIQYLFQKTSKVQNWEINQKQANSTGRDQAENQSPWESNRESK